MIKDFSQLVVKEVESFKNKGGEIGVIEHHLEIVTKEKIKLEEDLKELEKLVNYLETKKENIGG